MTNPSEYRDTILTLGIRAGGRTVRENSLSLSASPRVSNHFSETPILLSQLTSPATVLIILLFCIMLYIIIGLTYQLNFSFLACTKVQYIGPDSL